MSSSPDNSFDSQKSTDPETAAEPSEASMDSQAGADTPASESVESAAEANEPVAEDDAAVPSEAADSNVSESHENVSESDELESPESESSDVESVPAEPVQPAAAKPKNRGPIEEIVEEDEAAEQESAKEWYILKVQSNREKSICSNLIRRMKMAGLEEHFGEILVPTEDLVEYKNGKKKVTKQKLYPGYIVVNMAINDDTWFLVRETTGIGDFTGAGGKPVPMLPHEVDRIVKKTRKPEEEEQEEVKTNIRFKIGDHVRITEGTFENFEGDVEVIDATNGRVTVMINIFGRTTPVEMEHWQMEPV